MEFNFSLQPGLRRWDTNRINSQQPLVSIITPYYNGGKYLKQTCSSVLNQTFPWYEWIIVNDGSTNIEDIKLLVEIEMQDHRIRILHKENGGISSARNYGIQHAQSDLILPLDGDDLLEPTFIEYCWWMLQREPEAAWAYTDSVGFQGQEYLWHKPFDPLVMKRENLLTATALIRKEVLMSIGCYAEVYKHYNEDWYAWLKIISRGGYPVQSSGEPLFWYRRNDIGVLSQVKTDQEIARKNRKLIASAAAEIHNPYPGVIYPCSFSGTWTYPSLSSWPKMVYDEKDRTHILFLLSVPEAGTENHFCMDLLSNLDPVQFDTGIIIVESCFCQCLQKFRRLTPSVFNLAHFMELADYPEFISYYLISRQVDCIVVSGSTLGYALLPWIREHFPDVAIVDIAADCDTSCAVTVVEKTFRLCAQDVAQFSSHIQWLTSDASLQEQRRRLSEALQSCSPLAAELFVREMQLRRATATPQLVDKPFFIRVLRILREQGIGVFLKKSWVWIKRKIYR